MLNFTPTAVTKVQEILEMQEPKPAGLRIAVVGGGVVRLYPIAKEAWRAERHSREG